METIPFTAAQFDTALAQVRRSAPADGSLWDGLLAVLNSDEAIVSAALLEWHGIATISEVQWPRVKPVARAGTEGASWVSIAVDGQTLLLCEDPWSAEATLALTRRAQANTVLALARPGQTERCKSMPCSAPLAGGGAEGARSGSPVVAFVDQAIARAYGDGASDIHFETDRRGLGIKYRVDGVMAPGERMDDVQRAEEAISRIKVLAQLDITERRRPQDGRIHWTNAEGHAIDLRVSIMPSIFGEDAVLRLLDKAQLRHGAQQRISLDVLGFDPTMMSAIRSLAGRPHGMLLVTGPTGSGKTTTLYAALSEVNDGLEKIVTIEDPVEYELPGVLQIPVNEQKGLTFATGLRSILRHDPDKILVGEIRDAETAEIAVQSALTGHLVFTTVHANSVFDVLGRFQHFGIDPFALASALNAVVVQRLLRRLCLQCAGWRDVSPLERNSLGVLDRPVPAKVPVACGCDQCRGTGYRGRFVLAEVHELTDQVRDLMVSKTSMTQLKELVYRDPATRLLARALARVQEGATTLEEVARVVGLA